MCVRSDSGVELAHLYVDEHAVVRLVQDFVAFGLQRKLEGDLGSSCRDLSRLHQLYAAGHQLDGLQDTNTTPSRQGSRTPEQSV